MTNSVVAHALEEQGFAEVPFRDPAITVHAVATEIARDIGAVKIELPEQLKPSAIGLKGLNTYGGNYGLGELPLHTDLAHWHRPPRYILLRCVTGSSVVPTRVLDCRALSASLSPTRMYRALFSPRRPLGGRMFLLRMWTGEMIRWDSLFLTPRNECAREIALEMAAIAPTLSCREVVLQAPGSALLLDNWRVLHGRGPVAQSEINRSLDRVYMDVKQHVI